MKSIAPQLKRLSSISAKVAMVAVTLVLSLGSSVSMAQSMSNKTDAKVTTQSVAMNTVVSGSGSGQTVSRLTIDDKMSEVSVESGIRHTLTKLGIKPAILSITPSPLPSMYQVTLEGQPPLYVSADSHYMLQGPLYHNPSPKLSIPPTEPASQTQSGMPVSNELRQSLLKNMSMLGDMSAQMPLYHTAIPGVIWGMTIDEKPFITNTSASVLTSGEISVIEEGHLIELDENFERQKNRYIFSQLDDDALITYPATSPQRAVIYVATDINCPYCRRFHQLIPELNAKGVTVKAIGYPIYEDSPESMRQIWCETDKRARKQAFNAAMAGQEVANTCLAAQDNTNHLLANRIKATGLVVLATPMIFREDGMPYQASFESPEFLEFLPIE